MMRLFVCHARMGNLSRFYAKWLAQIMLDVTAGHEQAGAVEVSCREDGRLLCTFG